MKVANSGLASSRASQYSSARARTAVVPSVGAVTATMLPDGAPAAETFAVGDRRLADHLHRLVGEVAGDVLGGRGAGPDVHRLLPALERPDDLGQEPAPVVEPGADDLLAGRADRHAVGGLVVGLERQALPHRDR